MALDDMKGSSHYEVQIKVFKVNFIGWLSKVQSTTTSSDSLNGWNGDYVRPILKQLKALYVKQQNCALAYI